MVSAEPIPFDQFMDGALYGPEGFYSTGGSAGRRGDFITSPEVGPLFGAVFARFLDREWRRLGEPDEFTVVDAGAGPGTLARSVLAASPACASALRYVAVEVSADQRARHPDGIESRADFPADAFTGVVVANELIDNLPFRLAVFDEGWREAFVVPADVPSVPSGAGVPASPATFNEVLSAPFDPVPAVLPGDVPFGARAPLIDRACAWVEHARSMLRAGTVVVVDYGVPHTAHLARRPWRQWLRTYRGNERGDHYLAAPGSQDITIDIPFDQLPPPDAVRTQEQFLRLHGIDDLVEEGRQFWEAHAAAPGLEAMKMRSRVSEAEALLDPTGLGSFVVAEWTR